MARRIPEPSEVPAQPRTPKTLALAFDLDLDAGYAEALASSLPGEQSLNRKIAAIALGLLEQLAEGGIMLPPLMVRKMQDSFGRSPEVEDVLEQFEHGCGRKGGKYSITLEIDPAEIEPLRQAAEFNGFRTPDGKDIDVSRYYQSIIQTFWDNGDIHGMIPGTARVLMLPADHKALVELLGKDFANGTELAGLIRKYVDQQTAGLFSEPEPETV